MRTDLRDMVSCHGCFHLGRGELIFYLIFAQNAALKQLEYLLEVILASSKACARLQWSSKIQPWCRFSILRSFMVTVSLLGVLNITDEEISDPSHSSYFTVKCNSIKWIRLALIMQLSRLAFGPYSIHRCQPSKSPPSKPPRRSHPTPLWL